MKKQLSKLERILSSIVLALALVLSIKTNAEDKKPAPAQIQNLEDYANLFGREFEKEMAEKNRSIEDIKKVDLIKKYQNPEINKKTYPYFQFAPDEAKRTGFFIGEGVVDGLKSSTDRIDWIRTLKSDVSKSTNYELYLEGERVNEDLTATLKKQARAEQEQEQGTTRINLLPGKRFKIETSTGIKTFLDSRYEPAGELYTSFNNLSLLDYDLRRARISLNNKGELGIKLQKRLDYNWLGEIETATDSFNSRANVSLSKEIKDPNSRIKISAGEEREKGNFLEFNYGIIF